MKVGNAHRFIQELLAWYNQDGTLSEANDLLGAPHQWLFDLLWQEMLIDTNSRPLGGVSFQHILDVVLLHIAMRKKL